MGPISTSGVRGISGKLRKMCPPGRWTERPQSPRRHQVPRSKEEKVGSSDLDATYILSFGDKAYRDSLGSEVGKRVDKSLTLEATQRKSG